MKKILTSLCAIFVVAIVSAGTAFGAGFDVEKTSPKNNEDGVPLENLGVKVYFTEEVYNADNEKSNKNACKIVDSDGKEISSTVFFNPKDKKIALVLVDAYDSDGKAVKIEGKSEYKLVIGKNFKSASNVELGKDYEVKFTTVNPSTSMMISMGMMGVMVVAMIFASSRAMKKEKEEAAKHPGKTDRVNPYKKAKETGKSVEEIVAKDKEQKAKAAAEAAAMITEYDDDEDNDESEENSIKTFKVKGFKSAADSGSKYVDKKRAEYKKKALIEEKIKANKKGKGKKKK